VLEGRTGLHVPPREPARIAEALRSLLDNEGRRRAMGAAGAQRAQRFGWDRIAAETLDVAEQLAAERVPA
jgi:glycosyltransferase involved in cell wall biosynthesis